MSYFVYQLWGVNEGEHTKTRTLQQAQQQDQSGLSSMGINLDVICYITRYIICYIIRCDCIPIGYVVCEASPLEKRFNIA